MKHLMITTAIMAGIFAAPVAAQTTTGTGANTSAGVGVGVTGNTGLAGTTGMTGRTGISGQTGVSGSTGSMGAGNYGTSDSAQSNAVAQGGASVGVGVNNSARASTNTPGVFDDTRTNPAATNSSREDNIGGTVDARTRSGIGAANGETRETPLGRQTRGTADNELSIGSGFRPSGSRSVME